MGGVDLLSEAHAAGLSIIVIGDRLVISGPAAAESVVLRLLAAKPLVLAAFGIIATRAIHHQHIVERDHATA